LDDKYDQTVKFVGKQCIIDFGQNAQNIAHVMGGSVVNCGRVRVFET